MSLYKKAMASGPLHRLFLFRCLSLIVIRIQSFVKNEGAGQPALRWHKKTQKQAVPLSFALLSFIAGTLIEKETSQTALFIRLKPAICA